MPPPKQHKVQKEDLRFFKYVISLPGMASYLPSNAKTYRASQLSRLMCYPRDDYYDYIGDTVLGDEPLMVESKLPPRKLLPPKFNEREAEAIKNLLKDDNVNFIIFPLAIEANKECGKKSEEDFHTVLLAYHKERNIIEVWDDQFPLTQVQYKHGAISSRLKTFLPIFETFKMKVRGVYIPMIPETKYKYVKDILKDDGKRSSFHEIYASFLANYLQRRVMEFSARLLPKNKDRKAQTSKYISNLVPPRLKTRINMYLQVYDKLLQHNALYPLAQAKHEDMVMGGICPTHFYHDVLNDTCAPVPKDISIPQDYVGKKQYFTKHPEAYNTYILLYLMEKHPDMAVIIPKKRVASIEDYSICWLYDASLPRAEKWKLYTPDVFEKFMKVAEANENYRFIAFFLYLRGNHGDAHMNTIIIDKHTKQLNRFEPNVGYKAHVGDRGLNNGVHLDNALERLFKPYGFHVMPSDEVCPTGVHRMEWGERTKNVFDIGGNCFLWSLWLLDLRLSNPDVPLNVLMAYAMQEVKKTGSMKHFVNGYADFIVRNALRLKKEKRRATSK